MKSLIAITVMLLIFASAVFAQELSNDTELPPSLVEPGFTYSNGTSSGNSSNIDRCFTEQYDGEEYCIVASEESINFNKVLAPEIFNIVKLKMLETITEDYFKKHFNLKEVYIDGYLKNRNYPDSWYWSQANIEFSYTIGDYNISYMAFVKSGRDRMAEEGNYSIVLFDKEGNYTIILEEPRMIVSIINKDTVFSEARKCIGTKDVRFDFDFDPTSIFRIVALGDEPVTTSNNYNSFKMDLETGNVSCELVIATTLEDSLGSSGRQPRQNVPCYDCWKDYAIYMIIFVVILLGALIYIKKIRK